jgi:hypothetical protein
MFSPSASDWRWLAGVIDSEGHISMVERGSGALARRLAITNCCLPLLIAVATLVGGKIHTCTPTKWKQQFQWYCYGDTMSRVLACVLPYLIAKQQEAEIALSLSQEVPTRSSHHITEVVRERRRALLASVDTIRATTWARADVPVAFQPRQA